MSIRGLWIICLLPERKNEVIFHRKYGCVESQAKKLYAEQYQPIPENKVLVDCILTEFNLKPDSFSFQKSRDTCQKSIQAPVINLQIPSGYLWPLIVQEQNGYLFASLPLVDDYHKLEEKHISDIPSVFVVFSLISGIADFFSSLLVNYNLDIQSKISHLSNVLSICVPFGMPVETDLFVLQPLLQGKPLAVVKPNQKPCAWRPTSFKGKSTIQLRVLESIRSIQHENQSLFVDDTTVFGSIYCKAELEGTMAHTVSAAMTHNDSNSKINIDNLLYHSCVITTETALAENGSLFKLKFCPPSHRLKLLDFTAPLENGAPPIVGIYKLQGTGTLNVLFQISLNDNMKNNFEYCEARLPFFNRGKINYADCKPTTGSVTVSNDRKTLIWNIGQKFPTKGVPVSLSATVNFIETKDNQNDDPFCVGLNAYAQLNFKVNDFSFNGMQVDQKYIQVTPATKFKVTYSSEVSSSDFKIWNTFGESPIMPTNL